MKVVIILPLGGIVLLTFKIVSKIHDFLYWYGVELLQVRLL